MRAPALLLAFVTAAVPALADERSEKAAAEILKQRLQNEAPEDQRLLDGLDGREIVVVRGEYDHIEHVLKASGIKHTAINPMSVAGHPFHNRMIVMIDCPGDIGPLGRAQLEKFVRAGGLLYTTDWALAGVVQRAFPGTIRHNGAQTGDELVAVQVEPSASGQDDNIMSNILLRKGQQPTWWLEGSSYPIKVLDPSKVEVLASSAVMKKRYGAAPVVVRVKWHDGEIIHVVSHFYRQIDAAGDKSAATVAVDSYEGLTPAQKKDFKASGLGAVDSAGVESSYAFQRMTGNLVTSKLKKNKDLEQQYNAQLAPGTALRGAAAPSAAPAPAKTAGTGKAKVLERKGDAVRIRDDAGNEGWVDADQLR